MTIYEKLIAALLAAVLAGATIASANETREAVDKLTQVIYNEESIIDILDSIDENTDRTDIERRILDGEWSIQGKLSEYHTDEGISG